MRALEKALVPVPPLPVQQRIADYLDDKCGKIDAYVDRQHQIIDKLTAYKQSVITEAVTKGLDPTVPMKDSGVEWIGKIPKHWVMIKMAMICSVITDYVASGSFADLKNNVQYLDEPSYARLIRTIDVSGKNETFKPIYINEKAFEFLHNSNLFGGEVILPNIGASVGDVYIVPKLYEHMSLAPNSIMFKTKYIDKYYYYVFSCDAGKRSVLDICQSTAQPKFNKTEFRNIRLPVSSNIEQQQIVDYLDQKCAVIDEAISKKQALIDKMEAYKKSLIYEVVTGKKEV
jgi:type I restriction enzyme S subunit